jgi:hypothetical protein
LSNSARPIRDRELPLDTFNPQLSPFEMDFGKMFWWSLAQLVNQNRQKGEAPGTEEYSKSDIGPTNNAGLLFLFLASDVPGKPSLTTVDANTNRQMTQLELCMYRFVGI